ncbi:MAG: 50S ribosomal protein L11 methyltransferase [Desulfomonile sp.]|nr:50S ribosomal protein L11 methyltransferase [Desulfomonile sp.]
MTLEITLPEELADPVANFCHEHEARGVAFLDVDPGSVRVVAYFTHEQASAAWEGLKRYLIELAELFGLDTVPAVAAAPLKHENWAVLWKNGFTAFNIGNRLTVTPPWIEPERSDRAVIVIEPAEAFGTGTHETTRNCLVLLEAALDKLRATSEPVSVLDVGCGSGILALAAAKLGASNVKGIDNDPVAVEAARKNAALNGLERTVIFECASVEDMCGQWDVVAANLDTRTLNRFRDMLAGLFGRFFVVSGVPLEQWADVKTMFREKGINVEREIAGPEWGTGLFVRGVGTTA